MPDTMKPQPLASARGIDAAARRDARRAAALRANLARRKAQQRDRAAEPDQGGAAPPEAPPQGE